ncbi:MAG: 2-hydroxyacyl-CoA dehydratase [SAR324 cluster bacterium]|nr:2-hydroxyacyl-CoA dehydratase [SAR324 cluster bacterium]
MDQAVFTEWHDKNLDDILVECRLLIEDLEFPTLRRWRQAGGKVLGHFQVYCPEEIVHAAGMLPFKIRGASLQPMQADSHLGSYLCSILKTSFELVLSGRIELDMFVAQPICDAARNLAAVWGRNFSYPCEILYLPQNATSNYSIEYLRGEYDRFRQDIELLIDREISTDELCNSLVLFNQNRALLRTLYAIKRETPWLISVDEVYLLLAVGGLIPREEHNDLLQKAIPLIRQRTSTPQNKPRIIFEGGFCEQPPLDLLQSISQVCYVVDDDLFIGLRWILEEVPLNRKDPLYPLAEAYLESSSYSPVQHDLRKPKEKMLLKRIEESAAQGVIIAAPKMCEPALDEQVTYTYALDKTKIPYIVSEFEENMNDFDHLEMQLETFIDNLSFEKGVESDG